MGGTLSWKPEPVAAASWLVARSPELGGIEELPGAWSHGLQTLAVVRLVDSVSDFELALA